MAQQGRNMYKTFTNKDYIYCGALVGVIIPYKAESLQDLTKAN
jgi:hypothetical protein